MADRRDALIIATGEYDHEGLRHLRSAAADAQALAGVLGDPTIGGFAVDVLRDGSSHEVRSRIEDFFADRRPGDVLLLHLSCHGLKGESGDLYFTARDTRPQRLASTAISADFVQHCLRMSRSRSIVVLLDCCYGGAFGQGVRVRAAGDIPVMDSFPTGRGRAVITASSAMEYAFEGDVLADDNATTPSVFTSALVEGLRTGEADLDGDGLVSLDELYDYVYDRVRERNPAQTPTKAIEMSGDLYLARSRRSARLPEELVAALAAPNVFTRIGAVSGLRELFLGNDVPLAKAAKKELDRIAVGELPQVAEAARAALRELVLVPSTRVIELTEERPSWLLRLDGPPVARAGSWQVSDRRILVREAEHGLEVSTESGVELRGDLLIKSLAGSISVQVVARGGPVQTRASRAADTGASRKRPEPARPAAKIPPAKIPPVETPPAARREPAKIPSTLEARPTLTTDKVAAVLFVLVSMLLGLGTLTGHALGYLAFDFEVLAYVTLRLVQSLTTEGSWRRRRWLWGMCAVGVLGAISSVLFHVGGIPVLFWCFAALIEMFGRPIDRARAALIAVASVPSLVLVSDADSTTDAIVYTLNGWLAIALGIVTLASMLFERSR